MINNPNYSNTTPSAPAGTVNVTWQEYLDPISHIQSVSAYVIDSNSNVTAANAAITAIQVKGVPMHIINANSNVVAAANDLVLANTSLGNVFVTLPLSSNNLGLEIVTKKVTSDANIVVVLATGANVIDGNSSVVLANVWTYIDTVADGINSWFIV